MPISYFVQYQDKDPYQISGEVLYGHYIKPNTPITDVNASPNLLSLTLGSGLPHQYLEIEQGPPMKVTFRSIMPRIR
jgi:hypothetical protein